MKRVFINDKFEDLVSCCTVCCRPHDTCCCRSDEMKRSHQSSLAISTSIPPDAWNIQYTVITFELLPSLTPQSYSAQIPRWLLFVRGVVDSDDLPLNVGREILQQSRALRIIKQRLVKKCVEMMSDLASSNATAYNTFFKNFGKYIKVGIIEDEKSRDDLIPLIRFFSSNSDLNMTSLPEYVARMPEDQKNIYYVVGETRAQAAMSPTLGEWVLNRTPYIKHL